MSDNNSRVKTKPTPETIWKRPAYLPYVHSPLTDEAITQAEKQLGCVLPRTFLEILRVQNGGPLRFIIPDSVGDSIAGIGKKYPTILSSDLVDAEEYVDFSLDGLIPFDGDGHWYHCLDYRDGKKEPAVSYIDIECNSQYPVADSFSDFLNLMELKIDGRLVLTNVDDIEDAKTKLGTLFNTDFEDKISNIGVPYSMFRIGEETGECFWISGNKVASGYSGDSPRKFVYEGDALLFPELRQETVIFEAPRDRVKTFRETITNAGFELLEIEDAIAAG